MAESNHEVDGRVERKCKPCLTKDINRVADICCSTCNEFQCNDCSNGHKIYAFMKNHKLLSVSDGPSNFDTNDTDEIDMEGLDICKKHNKRYKFHCEDDKTLLCSTCAIFDHKSCTNIVELHIANNSTRETLRAALQTAISKTNQAVENLKEAESFLSEDVQKINEKLSKMRSDIINVFDEFAENVTKHAYSYKEQTTERWTKKTLDCETILKSLKSSMDIIEKGTPSQQFIKSHSKKQIILRQLRKADSLALDLGKLKVLCKFDTRIESFRSNLLSTTTPDKLNMKYSVPKTTRLNEIFSINLKQTDVYTGIDFLPDGRLVAVDNENGKCLLYDEKLKLKSAYTLPDMHPRGVVVISDEEVAITAGCTLVFLQVNKSNVIALNKTINVSVPYVSICMKDDENFVVSTNDNDTPVRVVSLSGKEQDFDIVFPTKKYPIDTSSCTYIRGQDKLVFADGADDIIYIYMTLRQGRTLSSRMPRSKHHVL